MMNFRKKILGALALVIASSLGVGTAFALTPNGSVTKISDVVVWQDDITDVVILTDAGDTCNFNANATNGKNLLSVVLAFYLSGKTIRLYCNDPTANVNGYVSHRLVRISAS
jgi:hypothetical protein